MAKKAVVTMRLMLGDVNQSDEGVVEGEKKGNEEVCARTLIC